MATRTSAPDQHRQRKQRSQPARKSTRASPTRWSARVSENSDAMDLQHDVFKQSNPRTIALSLKRSAEKSKRRKSEPFRSAMSMLNFYINRAGRNLPKRQLAVLDRAKNELRKVFRRPAATA